jgi:dolichol-phosphate mannosyltransferase
MQQNNPLELQARRQRFVLVLPVIVLAILGVLALDRPLAELWRDTGVGPVVDRLKVFRWCGEYWVTAICAAVLLFFHAQTWRAAGFLMLCGIAGLLNGTLKWVAGRPRPFTWGDVFDFDLFRDGLHGMFNQKNLSFASGHTTQAFAWATAMAIALPRFRWIFFTLATVVAAQRTVSNDHWLSDVVAGAVIGVVTVRVLFRILSQIIPPANAARGTQTTPCHPNRSAMTELNAMHNNLTPAEASMSIVTSTSAPAVSLVIPCYNEEENVPTLLTRVEASMNQIGKTFEVILIDDGSTDATPKLLADAQAVRPWLRVLRMRKNSGQSAGFEAGFAVARGNYIATIDADLQNDPEEVPRLVKMLDEHPNYDMITGWRKDRQDTRFRRWQSRQANKIRNWISQDDIHDSACSLKIYRRHAIVGLKLFNGAHRFFPALVKMRGYTVHETPVKHSQRFAGTAKYGFRNRAFRAFIDLLGVRWMKMRYLSYGADEIMASAGRAYT